MPKYDVSFKWDATVIRTYTVTAENEDAAAELLSPETVDDFITAEPNPEYTETIDLNQGFGVVNIDEVSE